MSETVAPRAVITSPPRGIWQQEAAAGCEVGQPAPPLVLGAQGARPAARTGITPAPAVAMTRRVAVEQVGPRPRRAVAPTPPLPPQRGRRVREQLGRIGARQVVCWQIAVVAVVVSLGHPWPVTVGVTSGAVLLAASAVRVGGRLLPELAVLYCGHLVHPHRGDLPETGRKAPALLALLVPGATVRTTATGHGPALTVSHPGGLAALLCPTDAPADPVGAVPLPADLLPDTADQVFGVQVVLHAGVRRAVPPKAWLAVHAARTAAIPRDADLALVLRNALRRVRRATDRHGVRVEPLAEEQALAAIAGLAHITGGRTEVREDWRFLRTGPVVQATFRLDGTGALADGETRRLVAALFSVTTGVATTVTLGARTACPVHVVLRVAATTEAAVVAAASAVRSLLSTPTSPTGIRLIRLDGAHSSGVAASLPIGVFLP